MPQWHFVTGCRVARKRSALDGGSVYFRLWEGGTDRERRLLRALAGDPDIEPTSTAARERYGLGAPSTVAKALSVLVAREVLARGGPRYVFDDPFFRRWVQLSDATA